MSNEVVKYKNELNKFSFTGLKETEFDIVFTIFHKFKEKGITDIEFSTANLKQLVNYEHKGMSFDDYAFEAFKRIQFFKIECRNPIEKHKLMSIIVFPIVTLDQKNHSIKVKISEEIANYLNAIKDQFTRFELAEFVNLRGVYAKTLYRLLKQFRTTGEAKFEWDEFKRLMGIPASYQMQNIDNQILKQSLKELMKPQDLFDTKRQPFTNLKYEKIKGKGRGRGGKVTHIKFTFDKISATAEELADFQLEPRP